MTVARRYVDRPRLARSLLAATAWVAAGRVGIHRHGACPVPDGDPGNHFSLTPRSVAGASRAPRDASRAPPEVMLPETRRTPATAAPAPQPNRRGPGPFVVTGDVLIARVRPEVPGAVLTYVARWGAMKPTRAEAMRPPQAKRR